MRADINSYRAKQSNNENQSKKSLSVENLILNKDNIQLIINSLTLLFLIPNTLFFKHMIIFF